MRLLFVSSTFDDMKKERELLHLTLLPKMKALVEKHGESVYFTPLYFGLKETDSKTSHIHKKTLSALFHPDEEIKPYMILFIGEKYGWIKENEITSKTSLFKEKQVNLSYDNEIEYLNLLSKEYNDRILFYVRELDDKEMDEEIRDNYQSISCLDKEKMRKFKDAIKKKFPASYRTYRAKYDKEKKEIVILDNLSLMVENDLKDLFYPALFSASRMSWQKRARIAPEHYLLEKSKNYYPFINLSDDKFDPYKGYLYDEYPILTIISGERGIGKSSYLGLKFISSKNEKLAFVFKKDEYSLTLSSFIKQLIYKIETINNIKHRQYKNLKNESEKELNSVLAYLIELINIIDRNKIIDVFIDRADQDLFSFLLTFQFRMLNTYGNEYYKFIPFRFYVVFDDYYHLPSVNALFDVSHRIEIIRQNDEEIKRNIIRTIVRSYKDKLFEEPIDEIIKKEDSSSPLYIKMIVHRLNHDNYYSNFDYKGDDRKNRLVELVKQFPGNVKDLTIYLIEEIASRYDEVFLYRIIMCILYGFRRISKEEIKDMFMYMKWDFDDQMYEEISTLLSVIFAYSEYTDTMLMHLDGYDNTIASRLNNLIISKGYLKYLGSFSSYYLNNKDINKHRRIALKLAFVRIDLALRNKQLNQHDVDMWMSYLMDVFFKIEQDFRKDGYDVRSISILIAETISYAILNGFQDAILIFIAFANNVIKSNKQYEKLFKGYFYFIRTDFSYSSDVKKLTDFFDKVFYSIEQTDMFGDYRNDFALWLKIKFTITKVRYYSISSPYDAKKELDDLLNYFEKENIDLPSFYKMQIYSTYLIIIAKSKDKNMFEDVFKNNVFTYFPFDDPSNFIYLRKEELENIYKAKIYSLIALAMAACYGDDKKYIFVPLVDKACEIFESHQSDYELTHFNSATYTSLIEIEALATPMYNKDPYVLNSFRYDARKFYPNSYFVLEAEASYFYWLIMMENSDDNKKKYYKKYLSRRKALAKSSKLLEAQKLYINVYAEFIEFISEEKDEDLNFYLVDFYNGINDYFLLVNNDSDFYDVVLIIGQFFESARHKNRIDLGDKLYEYLYNKYKNNQLILDCLKYLRNYYLYEEDVFELAENILLKLNNEPEKEKFQKMKSLLTYFEI